MDSREGKGYFLFLFLFFFSIWIIVHKNITLKLPDIVFSVMLGNLPENKISMLRDPRWKMEGVKARERKRL